MAKSEEKFWQWFARHEAELFDFERDQERIFDELSDELQKVDRDITFEFGRKDDPKEGVREFVVSAGGIRRAFSAVQTLVSAAPTLDHWQVTAFRPRRVPCIVELGEKRVDPEDVQFSLLDNGTVVGIYLFIPGFRDDDISFKEIGYLLLDSSLGEYDVETRVGLIEMLSPETQTGGDRYPLAQLPTLFDRLVAKLEGRSGGMRLN
jgi:hypothetical protein